MSSGEARPLGYARKAPLVVSENPGPRYSSSAFPGPCRLCGGPAWMQDELGSVHPCCQLWNRGDCPACKASESLNREHRRRGPRQGWREVKAEGIDG